MRFRTYRNADLTVSEVGFGMWTISTGWWGNFTEGEAIALMHKAFDLGVTLFDAADTYGNGLSEEYIAKAFLKQRDEIVIATKVGYDFVHHGEARGRGQREIPQDFSPDAITRATDAALKRLKTDRIDLLQLHNIRMEQVGDAALWKTLEQLKESGKIRYYGIALGPAIGWLYEGLKTVRERNVTSVQHMNPEFPDVAAYSELAEKGELTTRIYAVPMETDWRDQAKVGIRRAWGSAHRWMTPSPQITQLSYKESPSRDGDGDQAHARRPYPHI